MPPKTTFTKKAVIKAALKVIEEHGLSHLSVRKVAEKLNSSTAPVYSCFKSRNELQNAIFEKAKLDVLEYMSKKYTDRVFLNMGVGFVVFARDHKKLFRALFLEGEIPYEFINDLTVSFQEQMKKDHRFTHLPDESRNELLSKMWTFTYGLATQICVGFANEESDKYIISILLEVGTIIIADTLNKSNKN